MNESVKKSLEKLKNVLEEERKTFKQKISIKKTHTFTIIAMNCVQEQLITSKEIESNGQKTLKNGYLYAPFSQKHFWKCKRHSLNAAHNQKLLSLRKK